MCFWNDFEKCLYSAPVTIRATREYSRSRIDDIFLQRAKIVNKVGFAGQEAKSRILQRQLHNKKEQISTIFVGDIENVSLIMME